MDLVEKSYQLILLRLHCYFVEEHEYDDVFLKYNGKKIWPKNKKQQPIMMDTSTELNVVIENVPLRQSVVIELWDWDFLSPNDMLGTFTMFLEGETEIYTTDMVQNHKETTKAKYSLEWKLEAITPKI